MSMEGVIPETPGWYRQDPMGILAPPPLAPPLVSSPLALTTFYLFCPRQ